MVRGATSVLMIALAWACIVRASVLVPTYVLPPDSFVRDQRSLGPRPDSDTAESQRTVKRLIGGHMKIKSDNEYGKSKNSIDSDSKSESGKFAGVIVPELSGGTVGWNQGIWDDGMLMSSAGEGKGSTGKVKEDDEDKKTLSDQVAEGKYGLIQNEIFSKAPKRPGILSYEPNSETRSKDNLQNLGGLKKDEIWLAEDHLLVLKGGSFPERTKEAENRPWPPIDSYEAPKRQVKLPQKPKVPPPFPVRLSDDGPLIFLTPNGSIPAPIFPPFPTGEGEGPLPPPPFIFPDGEIYAPGDNQRNSTTGEAPLPNPPFPFLPGNASEGAIPFFASINGSFPEGYLHGAALLPPPSNQTDLYDEDDPSIYYPPPYNFSYHTDYKSNVPAGPLVPGIILPPPPDFFAPLEEKTNTEIDKTAGIISNTNSRPKSKSKRPLSSAVQRGTYKTRPTTTETTSTTDLPTTTSTPEIEIVTTPKRRKPQRVMPIPPRNPVRVHNLPDEIVRKPKTEKPVYKTRTKLTSKPLSVSVLYDYPEPIYDNKLPTTTEKPYIIYKVQQKTPVEVAKDVTSTSVPLRAYYTQNDEPTTKLQPVYNNGRPNEDAIASFYFFDEQPKSSPAPETYFDGRNYYKTVPSQPSNTQNQNYNSQGGFSPSVDVAYGSYDQNDALFLWPQKQGPRTLTQEYFSVQNPRQQIYVQQAKQRPDPFYQQIADIQQTLDLYTTKRPKGHSHRAHSHKQKPITGRPVYQFSYDTKPRPEKLTFRAPKLDPEPFRPMVSYSKPFNLENEFNAISPTVSSGYQQQYLVENVQVTTESPTSSRYYPKNKLRDEDYDDSIYNKDASPKININHIPVQTGKPVLYVNKYPSTTPNPISHGYYTKQDEKYFDDITKNSFDVFGQKLEDGTHDINGLAVTPPIGTAKAPIDNNLNQYAYEIVDLQNPNAPNLHKDTLVNDRLPRPDINPYSETMRQGSPNAELVQQTNPPSLQHDTDVNNKNPRPEINPDSEFVPIPNPNHRKAQQYRVQTQVQRPQYTGEQYDLNGPALGDDTAVNYKWPLPPLNPDAEWIRPGNTGDGRPGNAGEGRPGNAGEGRPGSYVSYRLPGEGAHVYFLTPQAAQSPRQRYRAPGYGR